jgi:hypothetical protein
VRLILKDKQGTFFTLNSAKLRPQERGGRGRKVFHPKGGLQVAARLLLQLLPGQTVLLTCPGCQGTRDFGKPGYRHVNLHCAACVEE